MPDNSGKDRRSELTELVKRIWLDSGKNQLEFVTWLLGSDEKAHAFGAQTLSKLIHGRLAEAPEELITALAARYPEYSVEELHLKARRGPRPVEARGIRAEEDVPMSFLCGHTVWAATFVSAMLDPEDGPHNVRFASFARPEEGSTEDTPGDPIWIESRTQPPGAVPGPWQDPNVVPLAAPDVIRMMMDFEDPGQVCLGLLPGQLVSERQDTDGRFVRLATLVDAAAACVLIVPEASALGPDPVSSFEVGEWLAKVATGPRAVVLGEPGTVAAGRARRITRLAARVPREGSSPGVQFTSHDLATRELRRLSWEEVRNRHPDAQAIVAWEPQASWFVSRSGGQVKRIPLLHLPEAGKPAEHLTFDMFLFVPEERETDPKWQPWRNRVSQAVKRLCREILPMIQGKQESVPFLFQRNARDDLKRLGTYYGFLPAEGPAGGAAGYLSSQEIEDIFGGVRFATSADPRGMKPWLFMPDPAS